MKQATVLWMIVVPLLVSMTHCDWGLLPVGGDAAEDTAEDPVTDDMDIETRPDGDADGRDDGVAGDPDAADPELEFEPSCGNGVIEAGETCDPPATCPTSCSDDGDPCTAETLTGSAADCTAACVTSGPTTDCIDGDGCCPPACDSGTDGDCSASCGDGVIDAGETCDPPATCPTSCSGDGDPCTVESLTGSAANCNALCTSTPVTGCVDGDGCCLAACSSLTDSDCPPACGNGVVEAGETCDPPASCPTVCIDDGDPCTTEMLTGSAAACTAACVTSGPITDCIDGDGCCPGGCAAAVDDDCPSVCGNGILEGGEECDFTGAFCVGCALTAPSGWTACTDSAGRRVFIRIFNPGSNQTQAEAREYCRTTIEGLGAGDYDVLGLAWITDEALWECISALLGSRTYFIGIEKNGGVWRWMVYDGTSWVSLEDYDDTNPYIEEYFDQPSATCGRMYWEPSFGMWTFHDYTCASADWDPICMVQY